MPDIVTNQLLLKPSQLNLEVYVKNQISLIRITKMRSSDKLLFFFFYIYEKMWRTKPWSFWSQMWLVYVITSSADMVIYPLFMPWRKKSACIVFDLLIYCLFWSCVWDWFVHNQWSAQVSLIAYQPVKLTCSVSQCVCM